MTCQRYTEHANKLQWQNPDGRAHYGTPEENFKCRVPEEKFPAPKDKDQKTIDGETALFNIIYNEVKDLQKLEAQIAIGVSEIKEMVEPLAKVIVELQLKVAKA